jgi:2-C-methyl-D-erythritol 2,4-cyclodiphosphate synthase
LAEDAVARSGIGFDVHRSAPGRTLRLGGIAIPGEDGLAGHSDGDVVCHAIADALLGAAALGDVGSFFPDTDPGTAGIAGSDLLRRSVVLLSDAGFAPMSVDVTVVAERPAIAPSRDAMRLALAGVLQLPISAVSVKATRPEGLGLEGDGIGCLAIAVVV